MMRSSPKAGGALARLNLRILLVIPLLAVSLTAIPADAGPILKAPVLSVGDFWSYDTTSGVCTPEMPGIPYCTGRGSSKLEVTGTDTRNVGGSPVKVYLMASTYSEECSDGTTSTGHSTAVSRASDFAIVHSEDPGGEGCGLGKVVPSTRDIDPPCVEYRFPLTVGDTWTTTCGETRTVTVEREETVGTYATLVIRTTLGPITLVKWFSEKVCQPVKTSVEWSGSAPTTDVLKDYRCKGGTTGGGGGGGGGGGEKKQLTLIESVVGPLLLYPTAASVAAASGGLLVGAGGGGVVGRRISGRYPHKPKTPKHKGTPIVAGQMGPRYEKVPDQPMAGSEGSPQIVEQGIPLGGAGLTLGQPDTPPPPSAPWGSEDTFYSPHCPIHPWVSTWPDNTVAGGGAWYCPLCAHDHPGQEWPWRKDLAGRPYQGKPHTVDSKPGFRGPPDAPTGPPPSPPASSTPPTPPSPPSSPTSPPGAGSPPTPAPPSADSGPAAPPDMPTELPSAPPVPTPSPPTAPPVPSPPFPPPVQPSPDPFTPFPPVSAVIPIPPIVPLPSPDTGPDLPPAPASVPSAPPSPASPVDISPIAIEPPPSEEPRMTPAVPVPAPAPPPPRSVYIPPTPLEPTPPDDRETPAAPPVPQQSQRRSGPRCPRHPDVILEPIHGHLWCPACSKYVA